jgi:hypothetical protein
VAGIQEQWHEQGNQQLVHLLARLRNVKSLRGRYMALCPAHDDSENSLSIGLGGEGRVLLKCFAGCTVEEVVQALGIEMGDLFSRREGGGLRLVTSEEGSTGQQSNVEGGCTLASYAARKVLPLEFLKELGLVDMHYMGKPAVRIPYFSPEGVEVAVRFRTSLAKGHGVDNRFRWRTGSKPLPYGLWRLETAREKGYVVLCEGESDAQTLWLHDEPALGLPGANSWREEWVAWLERIERVYVVVEPDRGGEAVRKWVDESKLRDRVWLTKMGDEKDPSGLYLEARTTFVKSWRALLEGAVAWSDLISQGRHERERSAWEACKELAHAPDILGRFAEAIEQRGVVGELRVAKLVYLAMTSRVLSRPVSVVVKGPSSAGKSFLVEQTLEFFPEASYYALTAMSERTLAYSQEPIAHRMLVIYEAAGLSGELATYLMRSLLSEGRVRYETIEKTKDGLRPRLIEREGPTGLVMTTTAASLHPENETRLLSISLADTPDQTRRVLLAIARERKEGEDTRLGAEWHALQVWLEEAEHRVTIPFARVLADRTPPAAVRLRRDFDKVLSLVRAHAVLHQASRKRDTEGWIVAASEDYRVVRELMADLLAEGVGSTVSEATRETVRAVGEIRERTGECVSQAQLAAELKLDKGAISRRVSVCLQGGYLRNLETQKGRPSRLDLGDPLPAEVEILPSVEVLEAAMAAECCTVDSEGAEVSLPPSPPARVIRCPMQTRTVCGECTWETRCSYSRLYDKYEPAEGWAHVMEDNLSEQMPAISGDREEV